MDRVAPADVAGVAGQGGPGPVVHVDRVPALSRDRSRPQPPCTVTTPAAVSSSWGCMRHKRPEPLTLEAVRTWVRDHASRSRLASIAIGERLNRWWLDGHKRDFTSVSFLIDRQGVIRLIHPGGTLQPDRRGLRGAADEIEQLLLVSPGHTVESR